MNKISNTQSVSIATPAWLELSGEDAADFLQSQVSADLRDLDANGKYTLWLDHRGKVIADSLIWKIAPEHYGLFSCYSSAETLCSTINAHIVADDVNLDDRSGEARLLSLQGPSDSWLARGPSKPAWSGPGYRLGGKHTELLLPAGRLPAWMDFLKDKSIDFLDPDSIEQKRMENGCFRIPDEASSSYSPLDLGLEDAISFDKGCFLGQEVVARLHRLGRNTWTAVKFEYPEPINLKTPFALGNDSRSGQLLGWLPLPAQNRGIGLGLLRRKLVESKSIRKIEIPGDSRQLEWEPVRSNR